MPIYQFTCKCGNVEMPVLNINEYQRQTYPCRQCSGEANRDITAHVDDGYRFCKHDRAVVG